MSYLFELGCEEIPARFLSLVSDRIRQRFESAFLALGLAPGCRAFSTPRRMGILVTELPTHTPSREVQQWGPPVAIAYRDDGTLSPAGEAFFKRVAVDPSAWEVVEQGGKQKVMARVNHPPVPIAQLLGSLVHDVFAHLPLPVSMFWGNQRGPFLRPIQWVVSMLDDAPLPLFDGRHTLGSIRLDPEVLALPLTHSRGHRWLTKGDVWGVGAWVPIDHASRYEWVLRDHFVSPDPAERRAQIVREIPIPSEDWDQDLLDELVGLCEWPSVIMSRIPDELYHLPDAPVVECIRKNQKYVTWVVDGRCQPTYWVVVDGLTPVNRDQVTRGNESVLRARLNDVLFFWNEDRRVRLESRVPRLDQVVYQEGLGSLGDKVRRLSGLCDRIASLLSLDEAQQQWVQRAALLCKADLVTGMVQELPALQGVMGGLYATHDGESPHVAKAIAQHYHMTVPHDGVSVTLWLSDRLDTVASCFVNGLIPTGSQDPWGVRRAALGVVLVALSWMPLVSLSDLVGISLEGIAPTDEVRLSLDTFYQDRLRYVLQHTHGFEWDLAVAVTHRMDQPLGEILQAAQCLQGWRQGDPMVLKRVSELAIRVQRLAMQYTPIEAVPLPQDELQMVRPIVDDLAQVPTFTHFIHWPPVMDAYFEAVMMMDEDPRLRDARLGFLHQIHACLARVADWEKVVLVPS